LSFPRLSLAAACAVLIACFACGRGEYQPVDTTPRCADHIEDWQYDGQYRAVFGMGEGAYAALQLALRQPGRFNVVAALNGPTSAIAMLVEMEQAARSFDQWPDEPSRVERLRAYRDRLAAWGNSFYLNDDSHFYPPGVSAFDFTHGQPKTLPPLYSPDNPNGTYPTVTIYDASGEPVDFWVAHDLNGNGVRDAGEPIVIQMHEPFDDLNGNGVWDPGEPFDDVGVDGVAGTDDYGENNGQFDWNPRVARWLEIDPATLAGTADLDLTPGYQNSVYLELLNDDPWGYNAQMEALAITLDQRLAAATEGEDEFCIANRMEQYYEPACDVPALTKPFWLAEKYALFRLPGRSLDMWSDGQTALRTGRFSQALRFISLRMPNGLDDSPKEDQARWQVREFYSEALQEYVRFGVGFPAGYFDRVSDWKSFPVVYIFHGRDSDLNDWGDILARQGDLARRLLAKQALLIVADGTRAAIELGGYQHYVNQAATEFGGRFGDAVEELIDYVEQNFRFQTRYFDPEDRENSSE
jgi:hypothetical protein